MRARPQRTAARWGDRGQEMAVELMILLPVALVVLALVVWAGRYSGTRTRLADVAAAAARAASLAPDEAAGRTAAARTVADSTLPDGCDGVAPVVDVRGSDAHPGSWRGARVTVTVSCTVRNADLAGVWTPGASRLSARASHPVDAFRAG